MKQLLFGCLVAALAVFTSPMEVATLSFHVETAEAGFGKRGGGGGGRARAHRSPGGAKMRARPGGGHARPGKARPGHAVSRPNKPALKPNRPNAKPNRPNAGNRPNRPDVGNRPNRPVGNRPGAGNRPGKPGVGHRPVRPRPPIATRPPGYRPPHYRPPHWRPPAWRPPYYRPPYVRPPHYRWGAYYWYPSWGWYFTAAVAGGTLAYVLSLPEDDGCQRVTLEGETLYECDGVLYRSTLYEDEEVYEIVSSEDESASAPPVSSGGGEDELIRLTSPLMRGEQVRAVQLALSDLGYDVGTVDGVFGAGTDRALRRFQSDNGLTPNGIVDEQTAVALGV